MGYSMSYELTPEALTIKASVHQTDGDEKELVASHTFECAQVHADLRDQTFLYGASKKMQDGSSSAAVGPEKLDEMKEIFGFLTEGTWDRPRKGGGGSVGSPIQLEAIARMRGVKTTEAAAMLKGYTSEQRKQIFANPEVKKVIDTIEGELADVDTSALDSLLAG